MIISRFKKTDGTWTSWQYNEYGTEQVGWKFGAWAVAAPENYTEFRIGIQYARNSGTCMFSNMFIHREQFAESFAYDEDNNLISTTNLSAEKSDMKYDAFDNLTSYVQPGADSADKYLFTYGSTDEEKKKHLVMSETTPMGLKQYYAYDAYGNRTATRAQKSSSEPRIRSCTWYDSTGNYPVRTMDARGNEVTKEVDADSGLIYNVTDPAGQKVEYAYDTSKRVTGVQTTDGDKVYKNAYTYENDRIKTVSHNTTGENCDVAYTFGYDALGRKTTVHVGSQVLSTNVYTNDRDGLLKEVCYGNGGKVAYEYDDFDRVTSVKYDDEATPRYEYEYGANGQASFLRDNHLGRITQTEYDLAERPCQSTIRDTNDNLIYRSALSYDKMNRLESFREETANGSHKTSFTYDKDNRTTAIQYDDENHKVEYTYDSLGRITNRKVTNGTSTYNTQYEFVEGSVAHHGENATTPLVKKITQTGANFGNKFNFEYEYDSRGNITSETRGGLKTTYAYDALGQLISVNDPHEGVVWYYKYDCGGNILEKKRYHRKSDGSVGALLETIPYEYGDPNWKDKLTKYNGKTITYDAIGNPLDDGDRIYEWEAGRRLKKVTVKWKPEDGIENGCHAETGTILKIEFSNTNLLDADVTSTVASAHIYNGGVEITSQYAESSFEWSRNSGNTTADATWNAAHKGMKSVTIKKSELTKNTQFTCTLTKIQPTCGDIMVDEDGNLLYAASENGDVFFLDEDGYLCVENPQNSYKFDGAALCMDTTTSLGTVSAKSWVYTARGSDKIVEFKYNSEGLRVQKNVTVDGIKTTTKYILNGKLLAELNCGNDVLKFSYDAQGHPASVDWNGSVYAYVHNLQGDIVGILDNAGTLIVKYEYDAWGKLLSITGSLADTLGTRNPFRYRGYVYDEETGLYYLRSRYYFSNYGRFVNADTVIGAIGKFFTHNQYAYCAGNPVLLNDMDGDLFGISFMVGLAAGVVGAFMGAAAQIAANIVTGANTYDGVVGAAVGGAVYNIVSVYSYGDTALASYASAAAESLTNEVVSYTPLAGSQQKKLIRENVYESLNTVAKDTLVNGTAYWITGKIADRTSPVTKKINSRKRKIRTMLATPWGRQMAKQTIRQSYYNFNYVLGKSMAVAVIE